jgi:hypothetical protein
MGMHKLNNHAEKKIFVYLLFVVAAFSVHLNRQDCSGGSEL